jgi:RHS repeat-associated protein
MTGFVRYSRPTFVILVGICVILTYCFGTAVADDLWEHGGTLFGNGTGGPTPPNTNSPCCPAPCGNNNKQTDPVFIDKGEFHYSHTDVSVPGRGLPLEITRSYRSQKDYNGRWGYGWFMSYDVKLKKLTGGNVQILYPSGQDREFTWDSVNERFQPPAGEHSTLVRNQDYSYTLTEPHGQKYDFNSDGRLSSIRDRNDNQLTFAYDPAGRGPIYGELEYVTGGPHQGLVGYDYKLIKVFDTKGDSLAFDYDTDGHLETITDWTGRTWTYGYDTHGNLWTVTTPETLTTTYQYDAKHNLTTITDPEDQTYLTNHFDDEDKIEWQIYGADTTHLVYNDATHTTTITDRKGFHQEWTFDESERLTSRKIYTVPLRSGDPEYFETSYEYNTDNEVEKVTYPKGNWTKYAYDAHGNVTAVRRGTGAQNSANDLVDTLTYEPNFNFIKTITNPKGHVITLTYDYEAQGMGENGNLVRITYPQVGGQTPEVNLTYNSHGQIETITDPNGNVTRYEYHTDTGYLWKVRRAPNGLNATYVIAYDEVGNITAIQDPLGNMTNFEYDDLDRLTKTTAPSPKNYQTKYEYDGNGNLTRLLRQMNPEASAWQTYEYAYTNLNQLHTITDPLDYVTTLTYDDNGNLHSVVDADTNETVYDYDERDLLWKTTDAEGGVTEYSYDPNGNLAAIEDANTHTTSYLNDDFDRQIKITYADTKFDTLTYDKNSNLTSRSTNGAPATLIQYGYDALDRLTSKTFPTGPNTTCGYDLGSRLTDAANGIDTLGFAYDALDRVTNASSIINGHEYELGYLYDLNSNRTRLTYPSGFELDYAYDVINRMTQVDDGANLVFSYTYDTLSRFWTRRIEALKVLRTDYTYDDADHLLNLSNKSYKISPPEEPPRPEWGFLRRTWNDVQDLFRLGPGLAEAAGYVISEYTYTYDNVGNRRTMQKGANTTSYWYDHIYELTSTSGAQTHSYDYDAVGNRETADNVSYVPTSVNQYDSVGGVDYTYDDSGNLHSDGTNTYTYDYENRLSTVTTPSHSLSFGYDPLGRRISTTVDGTTTFSISDDMHVVAEYDGNNSLLREFTYGPRVDEVVSMLNAVTGTRYYYLSDGLGSVSEVVATNTAVTERYEYTPFGTTTIKNGSGQTIPETAIGNPWGFTGRRYDAKAALYDYRARHYIPTIGRFMQKDPPGYVNGMNLYQYVKNNPINLIDAFGLQADHSLVLGSDYHVVNAVLRELITDFLVSHGVPTESEHRNRNLNNRCPRKEPGKDNPCGFEYIWYEGKYKSETSGYECRYDKNGNLLPDDSFHVVDWAYTYNYGPKTWSVEHFWKDLVPIWLYGNTYVPGLTTSY